MRIRITKRPPVSREHGLAVGQEYTAIWVDPPEARNARIQITSSASGLPVCLEEWEWEEINEQSEQENGAARDAEQEESGS